MATTAAIRQELDSGSLIGILPDWNMGSVDMPAVFTGGPCRQAIYTRLRLSPGGPAGHLKALSPLPPRG